MRLAIITLFLIIGCGPKPTNPSPDAVVKKVSIHFEENETEEEKALIIESVQIHVDEFERQIGFLGNNEVLTPRVDMYTVRGDTFECVGLTVTGCFQIPGNRVSVIHGRCYELPSLFHEFGHWFLFRTTGDLDPEHTDPRWSNWNMIGQNISHQICQLRGF